MAHRRLTLYSLVLFLPFISMVTPAIMAQTIVPQNPDTGYQVADTKNGLNIFAKLDREFYKLKDRFTLTVGFKNVAASPIVIYKNMRWGAFSSLFLETMDQNGELLHSPIISEGKDAPPFRKEDFITLQPNETFSIIERFTMGELGIRKAGDYKLFILYECPVTREFVPKEINVWTKESGRLEAKPVIIKIIE